MGAERRLRPGLAGSIPPDGGEAGRKSGGLLLCYAYPPPVMHTGRKLQVKNGETQLKNKARRIAYLGLLLAMAVALSALENALPGFTAVPGIRLGLSNIVTMYALFFMGAPAAFTLAGLKSGFVLLTRGVTAGMFSLAGGLLSVGVMLLANRLHASRAMTSVAGAVCHNLGQLAVAWGLLRSAYALYYLPVLVLSGIGMGLLTAVVLRLVLPALARLGLQFDGREKEE